MRKWNKYSIVFKKLKNKHIKKNKKFIHYEKSMGGYKVNKYYKNKKIFNNYFLKERFIVYHHYLKKNLKKNSRTLSIASGRCINELQFIDKGFNIECSDLDIPQCYNKSKKLFKKFNYFKINILKNNFKKKYHTILALGLVFTFSKKQLFKFFQNINRSLYLNGNVILDSSSSEDNFFSNFFDNFFLRYEIKIISFIFKILGKTNTIIKKHHGYKFKNKEIIKIAKKSGFELIELQSSDYFTEILRSKIIGKINNFVFFIKYMFIFIGIFIPYIKIYQFKKIKEL